MNTAARLPRGPTKSHPDKFDTDRVLAAMSNFLNEGGDAHSLGALVSKCLSFNNTVPVSNISNDVYSKTKEIMETIMETGEGYVYSSMIAVVEAPMLEAVMVECNYNQTRGADMLGINRATLSKKLKKYRIL